LLSIEQPHLLPHLHQLKYGIQPVIGPPGRSFFVIKISKEAILAARIKNGLKVYLFADDEGPASHLGIVTAFPDDHDEPTIVATTLFDGDDLLRDVRTVLSQPQFKLYLFDEHDRELMGVWVRHRDVERFRREIGAATFAPFDLSTFAVLANRLYQRFGIRNATDEEAAFTLSFGDRLYPDHPAMMADLVREDPGPPQERDIAAMVGRSFPADAIYVNPFRADTGKELTDVLVVTDRVMLLIEAKDSPNTPLSLERTLDRKRLTIQKQIVKAANQLRGGLTYAKEADGVVIVANAGPMCLPLGGRQLLGLIVVREMFDHDQQENSDPVLALVDDVKLPVMLIDYPGLHAITTNLRTPAGFLSALHDLFDMALEHGRFPRSVWNGPPAGFQDPIKV
jgi:hypothetical protein